MFNFFKKNVKKSPERFDSTKLQKDLNKNIEIFNSIFKDDDTLNKRLFENQHNINIKFCAFFLIGMVNIEIINDNILKPLILTDLKSMDINDNLIDILSNKVLFTHKIKKSEDLSEIIDSIIYGDTILFINGFNQVLIISSKGWEYIPITDPEAELVLRGPREGFNESLLTNISLIRRRLKTNDLKFKNRTFGTRTNTNACICYLDSLVDKKILDELNKRLDKIKIDGVLDTNYINEHIKDSPVSPFKTVGITEKPDSVAAKLLEGRIAIILDGTPVALTVPYLFIENFQTSDDYYLNFFFASFSRLLRILGFLLSTVVPAIYVALTTYHREMIPPPLALNIASAHQGLPLPIFVECVLMLIVFDLIRETGLRMPANVGQALSVVGALVIGQAAVQAKFISAPMIIIVAISAITELINIKLKGITVIIRFIFICSTALLGFYGLFFTMIAFLIHIYNLTSLGIEYTSQLISYKLQDAKDTLIRAPWWYMITRPKLVKTDNIRNK
ncbi:MAG: GerA spore germination protein [Clostridia bacterium]|nr:GerA spore germination protein [Clostridia bacterium]